MTTALPIVAVAAALACSLQMLRAMRRGMRPVCCASSQASQIDRLAERERLPAARVARTGAAADAAALEPREAGPQR